MSERKHFHLRLLFCHKGTKNYTVCTFHCCYQLERSYLQVNNHTGLPCYLLHLLNKSYQLITTSSPSTSHTTSCIVQKTLSDTTFCDNEVSLSLGCKKLILLLKEMWKKVFAY